MICDFPKFLSIWNATQGQKTPRVHIKIAKWLYDGQARVSPRLLLMAFRSCGKSTLVGVFCAWILAKAPDTRILVLSADLALARKMVRNVKRIIERHPMTRHLKPEKLDQWGSEKFTVKRAQELRDPSMLAKGITTNLTGTRADIIICDDVEVPKTSDTVEKRDELRERLMELDYILTPNGMQLYVGTPHCWHTIYADVARGELGEDTPFLDGFHRLVQPITDESGKSVWPDRFPDEDIEAILKRTGPAHFKSQMMCEPVNSRDLRLDPSALQFYSEDREVSEAQGERKISICGRKMVSVAGWWDPAFGRTNGDKSILAIMYCDEQGEYWLHHLSQIRISKESGKDEATQQCETVAKIIKQFHLPFIAIETNGIGQFLPGILKRELLLAQATSSIRPIHNRKLKATRIIEAFDAVMAARALHVHRSVLESPFIKEMEDWRPEKRGGRDDCLDAVAGALSLQPVRIGKIPKVEDGNRNWIAIPPKRKPAKTVLDI